MSRLSFPRWRTLDNASLRESARSLFPGGVNSPVRSFRSVGGNPVPIARGAGAYVYDVEDRGYIDYVAAFGPLILGHAHPGVLEAMNRAAASGTAFGALTPGEVSLGERVVAATGLDRVRFVNSGTEATMTAIRLARAAIGRDLVVKFDGCYHGHSDGLLVKAGSGVATLGLSDSAGVPQAIAGLTAVLPFNDPEALRTWFRERGSETAAVIVEPIAGNMGTVPPAKGFLQKLRKLTREHGTLLIFDEVITGFRVSYGGAQELYSVKPDMTCLGKIIGGGLPVGAYGGNQSVMKLVAPEGPVYQAGTLSGNPLAVTAGIATLEALKEPGSYKKLEEMGGQLAEGLLKGARKAGVPIQVNRVGSMLTMFFADQPVTDFRSARGSNTARYSKFFHAMLDRGIYPPPSQFEAWFVSLAHSRKDIDATARAAAEAFRLIVEMG